MRDILEEIIERKHIEVQQQKEALPPKALYAEVEHIMQTSSVKRSMSGSIAESPYGIIAEFKRKSPSKGWIHEDSKVEDVVPMYAANGASALSILTDEFYFGGSMEFVERVRGMVQTPILRKDFIIDEYQLFQAKKIGADAVLLIAAALPLAAYKSLLHTAHELGLEVLLETHSTRELDYADTPVDMVGVNNRNLGTFHTDVENSFRMAEMLPKERIKVSESGISRAETIRQLRSAGFNGFLIGENFMKEGNPGLVLKNFIAEIEGK